MIRLIGGTNGAQKVAKLIVLSYFIFMSPVVFEEGPFRFLFFSNEETRIHVHILSSHGDAKFWIKPIVSLCKSTGYSAKELTRIQRIVEEHKDEIKRSWKKHFKC
jgi:hypothetical protein